LSIPGGDGDTVCVGIGVADGLGDGVGAVERIIMQW